MVAGATGRAERVSSWTGSRRISGGSIPVYFAAFEALGEAIRDAGPLNDRTLHLVQLAAALACG